MKKKDCKHRNTEIRQAEVIKAALECFMESGIAQTSIAEICRRSHASVGSIYHHFKGKEQLAATVYMEGIRDYQKGFIEELLQQENARDGIFSAIRYYLIWVDQKPDWAKYLMHNRHAEFMSAKEESFRVMNTDFMSKISGWFGRQIDSGALRKLPPDIFTGILLGPCQEFARIRLSGNCLTNIDKASHELGLAAWRALGIES
jgi:AcrR family transcriptional regulator